MPSQYLEAKDLPRITVYGEDFRHEVAVMYNVVVDLNLWDWMKIEPPADQGYMFWDHPNVDRIINHPKVAACGHSGATGSYCLRIVQKIIRVGLEQFKEEMTK